MILRHKATLRVATAVALVASGMAMTGAVDAHAAPPSFVTPVPYANPQTPDETFFNMRLQYFLPETESLIKQTFGSTLRFEDAAFWEYASYYSRAVSFATNLPTLAKIEYGTTTSYGHTTEQTESYYYQHLLYLRDLQPGQTYHYRIDVMGSDGAVLVSGDKQFTTPNLPAGVIRIPQDLPGQSPPYRLTTPNATYLLTTDLNVPNGGIVIDVSDVVLDLGGHTITYDNAVNPIINETMPTTTRADFMYNLNATFGVRSGEWNLTNQKIFNGKIVQGTNGGAGINGTGYNPIYCGATYGIEIAGITADYYGDNINGIEVVQDNYVHHNVVYDRGTGIDLRDIQMRAITGDDTSKNVTAYNSVRRCRQVGISTGGQMTGNEVYDDSYSTNSFLLGYASNSRSENNKLFGLGYMPVGIGGGNMHDAVARNNFIYVVAYAPNQRSNEYNRLSAVSGFRPQVYPGGPGGYDNNLFENNVIVGHAFPGSVSIRGLWVGSDMLQHNMVVRNNTVKVETMTDDIADAFNDAGYSFSCVEFQGQDQSLSPPPVLFQNNTLITNLIFIVVGSGYGVGSNGYFYDTTFQKIDHNSVFFTPFRIGYWIWNSYGVKVIDSTAGPGVDLSAPIPNISGDSDIALSLDIGISSTRVYADGGGAPLANTKVTWQTDGGDSGSFTTNANGEATNEWMTTHNRHVPGDPARTMTQVQNRTITFTVAGYDPVTMDLASVQSAGTAIQFGDVPQPQPQTLAFAQAAVTKTAGDAPFTNPLTHTGGGALSYTSTDPAVATVDNTGLVTIIGAGQAGIGVTAAAVPGEWLAASASYVLTVNPAPSSDSTLATLTVDAGTLTPAFDPATTNYTVTVGNQVTTVTIGGSAADAKATVAGTGAHALTVGQNKVNVTVTAQDGTTTTYTITITRQAPVPAPSVTLAAASVTAGQTATAYGTGFTPGEIVSGTMRSTPLDLGQRTADATGRVTFTWTVPGDTTPGNHTVELTGATSGTVSAGLTVLAAPVVNPPPVVNPTAPTAPTGGTAVAPTGAAGFGFIALGVWLIGLYVRRRIAGR